MLPQEILEYFWLYLRQLLLKQRDALCSTTLHLDLDLSESGNDSRLDDRPGRFYRAVQLAAVRGNEVHLTELLQQLQLCFAFMGTVVV